MEDKQKYDTCDCFDNFKQIGLFYLNNNFKQIGQRGLFYLPTIFFLPEEASARALMTFPRVLSDWLMAEPSFSLSPVAPVESALSLKYCKDIKYKSFVSLVIT